LHYVYSLAVISMAPVCNLFTAYFPKTYLVEAEMCICSLQSMRNFSIIPLLEKIRLRILQASICKRVHLC